MELLGEGPAEGAWIDGIVGLDDVRVDVAYLRTPDGHGAIELTKFHSPLAATTEQSAPANTLGLRRVMFTVDDIDDTVARLQPLGGELIGTVEQYGTSHRLCYVRGPQGVIISLAEELN